MKKREMVRYLLELIDYLTSELDVTYPVEGCNCEECQAVRQARAYVGDK